MTTNEPSILEVAMKSRPDKMATVLASMLRSVKFTKDGWLTSRRAKKGKRAKSGQWWRRSPRSVLWGSDVGRCIDATIGRTVRDNA